MTTAEHDALKRACQAVHRVAEACAREGLRALNGCGWLMVEPQAREWIIRNPESFGDLIAALRRHLRAGLTPTERPAR